MRTETKSIGQTVGDTMTSTSDVTSDVTTPTGTRRNLAGLRKHLIISILLDVALPLAGFYVLRGFGIGALAALLLSGLLVLPGVGYSVRQQRKVNMLTVFTISLLVVGALMSVITGSPRLLLVREAWLFLVVGLWMLGTVPTRRPVMMIMGRSIVIAKVGMEGLAKFEARWDAEAAFRRATRILSSVWGLVFTLDALLQVAIAYTLPVDRVPLVSTVQWLVVLAGLITFHAVYTQRKGLRA
ncbi:MAG TPA: VC0807 family protein [Pseudonocardiaceae bacterium]|nr:VC0807 family protein [Pseudonocardiaceae bacterium]